VPFPIGSAVPSQFPLVLSFWELATEIRSTTDDFAGLTALVSRDPEALLVACDGGDVVGTLIAAWDGWRAAFYRLAVHPELRRHGLGRALVAEGESRLRDRGARRISLYAVEAHTGAMSFWHAVGYQPDPTDMRFVRNLTAHP
jgi:ribosomal protein S18 acetylase RimI-like enzyme